MRVYMAGALVLFTSMAAMGAEKAIIVAVDGSGDFKTIQEAVAAAPEKATIQIKAGDFKGPVILPRDKPGLTLVGQGYDKTTVTWDHNVYDPAPPGTGQFDPGFHVFASNCTIENMTIRNVSGDHGQALALRLDGDRTIVRNCHMLGWQDTLMANNGRHYFKECYIEGRVDFIYGSGTAVFDHCEVHSKNGGFVTAANTPQDHPFGFVFLDCKLTGDDVPWNPATTNPATPLQPAKANKAAYLGRPWRPYAAVAYLRCELGDHIQPAGWDNWGKASNEQTARYAEYNNTGPGATPEKRATWAKQLTAEEAAKYTISNILGGTDQWDPAK